MPPAAPSSDLVVVGGGIIGLATAREAARRGLRVTLLERDMPGRGATWAAAGMLSPLSEAGEGGPFLDFSLESLALYPDWVEALEAESGVEVEYRACGKLRLARTGEEIGELERARDLAQARGLHAELVPAEALAHEVSGMAPGWTWGLRVLEDHRVDPRRLGEALLTAARRAGVEVRTASGAAGILHEGARIRGVRLDDGATLAADRVLLAAGAWSGIVQGLPRPLHVRPVRGQMLALHPETLPSSYVLETPDVYLVPRDDGRLLVGATVEEAGFEGCTTAAGIRGLLAAAIAAVPELARARTGELWWGFRPGTPDGHPILGEDPEMQGLLFATGHFRNGILLAPATAQRLGALAAEDGSVTIPPGFLSNREPAHP